MPELIDKNLIIAYLNAIKPDKAVSAFGEGVIDVINHTAHYIYEMPTVPDINRAEILRLCNEIEDNATTIAYLSDNQQVFDCSHAILDRVELIGKELTGDAGSKID